MCNIVFFLYLLYVVFIFPSCKCKYCHKKCCNQINVIKKKKKKKKKSCISKRRRHATRQKQLCTVQHTFFVHFFAVVLHDYNVKLPETKLPSYKFYEGIVVRGS